MIGPSRGWALALAFFVAGCGDGRGSDEPNVAFGKFAGAAIPAAGADMRLSLAEAADSLGIDFTHETGAVGDKWMPETVGSGGGFFDYDSDGWPDLFLVNGSAWPGQAEGGASSATQKLYRNEEGRGFKDVSVESGLNLTLYGMGAAFGDYDADGDLDIFLTALGDNRLLRNDEGRFVDVATQAGVGGQPGGDSPSWSTCAAWLDVDRDGWLDLFVCNYVRWTPATDLFYSLDGTTKAYATPQPYAGETNRLYRNIRGRRFVDVTETAGLQNDEGKSLGVAIYDFNDDGWPDIFVANDTEPDFLYINEGDGSFSDIALRAGVGYDEFGRARAGMGVDVATLHGTTRAAIAVGNFSGEPVALFTPVAPELFRDEAGRAGLTGRTLIPLTFGVRFADLDLDGDPDLLLANGHIQPGINTVRDNVTFAQRPQLFSNDGTGQFTEVSGAVGVDFQEPVVGRGLATADVDRDGDLDILLTVNGGRARLFLNHLNVSDRRWLRLRLNENTGNRNAIGARVDVHAGGTGQRQFIATGSSYLSQSEVSTLTFGLGSESRIDSVVVRWPTSGAITRHGPFETNQEITIQETP